MTFKDSSAAGSFVINKVGQKLVPRQDRDKVVDLPEDGDAVSHYTMSHMSVSLVNCPVTR